MRLDLLPDPALCAPLTPVSAPLDDILPDGADCRLSGLYPRGTCQFISYSLILLQPVRVYALVIFLPLCCTTGLLDAVIWGTSMLSEWLGVRAGCEVASGLGE